MKMLISKGWPYLLVVVLGATIYFWGNSNGQSTVQKKWDDQKIEDRKALQKLQDKYNALQRNHSYEVGLLTSRLQTAESNYASELARVSSDYDSRMQQSERRASVYKRQAEAGTFECRSLASHAARLDSSLEEGRRLVEELRATVRLRDSQLIELGKQIQADRKLFEQE